MLVQQHRLDVISNNLANVTTPGYRADRTVIRAFPDMALYRVDDGAGTGSGRPAPVGRLGTGAFMEGTVLSLEEGPLETTGNPLDAAIVGEGFFLVETPAGQRLTRDGGFTVDGEGRLVTRDGHPVLDRNGQPIVAVQAGQPAGVAHIDAAARLWVGGQQVAELAVVSVNNPALLRKEGGNRFAPTDGSGPVFVLDDVRLEPGHREGSNVGAVTEMVRIISAFRAYEAAQRTVQAHDDLLDRAVNEVGRL